MWLKTLLRLRKKNGSWHGLCSVWDLSGWWLACVAMAMGRPCLLCAPRLLPATFTLCNLLIRAGNGRPNVCRHLRCWLNHKTPAATLHLSDHGCQGWGKLDTGGAKGNKSHHLTLWQLDHFVQNVILSSSVQYKNVIYFLMSNTIDI